MKRKVALLLAVVMIVTMLPMNVFGSPIFRSGFVSTGHQVFHMEISTAEIGQQTNLTPTTGPQAAILDQLPPMGLQPFTTLVENGHNVGAVTLLMPVSLTGANLQADLGAGRDARRFIPRTGVNGVNTPATQITGTTFGLQTTAEAPTTFFVAPTAVPANAVTTWWFQDGNPVGSGIAPLGPMTIAAAGTRFSRLEFLRLPALNPLTGEIAGWYDVRFIPYWDPAAGAWSATEGWLDIRGVNVIGGSGNVDTTTVPFQNSVIRIPFLVNVTAADATITVRRSVFNDNSRSGAMLWGGPQSLLQLQDGAPIGGANITLTAPTVSQFTNVLGIDSLVLTETITDRIRNFIGTEATSLTMGQFPIHQSLSLRYAPMGQVNTPNPVFIGENDFRFVINWGTAIENLSYRGRPEIGDANNNGHFDWVLDPADPSVSIQQPLPIWQEVDNPHEIPLNPNNAALAAPFPFPNANTFQDNRAAATGQGRWQQRSTNPITGEDVWTDMVGLTFPGIVLGAWATAQSPANANTQGTWPMQTAPAVNPLVQDQDFLAPVGGNITHRRTMGNTATGGSMLWDATNLAPGTATRFVNPITGLQSPTEIVYSFSVIQNAVGPGFNTLTGTFDNTAAGNLNVANAAILPTPDQQLRHDATNHSMYAATSAGHMALGGTAVFQTAPGRINNLIWNAQIGDQDSNRAISTLLGPDPLNNNLLANELRFNSNSNHQVINPLLPLLAQNQNYTGRVWWYVNGVAVSGTGAAAGIPVSTTPITPPNNTLAPSVNTFGLAQDEWLGGFIPFVGADHDRILAARPDFRVDGHNLGWFTLRLVAPEHYRWNTVGFGGNQNLANNPANNWMDLMMTTPVGNTAFRTGARVAGTSNPIHLNSVGRAEAILGSVPTGWAADFGRDESLRMETIDGIDHHVLYLRINAGHPNFVPPGVNIAPLTPHATLNGVRAHLNQLGVINITGLQLFPTAQAPIFGEVAIDWQWGWSARTGNPWDTWFNVNHAIAPARTFPAIVVGNRDTAQVNFTRVGDPPVVQTGLLGNRITGTNANNGGNNAIDHYRGVATATVRLEESIPGIMTSNWAAPIEFTLNPELAGAGVRILGAIVNAGNNAANNNIINNWNGFLDTAAHPFAAHTAHVNVEPDRVVVNLPIASQVNLNHRTAMTVQLFLSVEADYLHKYGTDEIQVAVSGLGVAALPEASRVLTIAYASDPISVELDGDILEVYTDALFGVAQERLSDVRVTIHNPAVLLNNEEIWLYLIDSTGARTEFFLDPNRVTVDVEGDSAGLILARPRALEHPHTNFQRHGVAVTVQRQPVTGVGPFDIVFRNLYITGRLIPGRDYQVAVSGTRIAQNDQTVQVAFNSTAGIAATIPQLNVGTFTALPYARSIVVDDPASGIRDTGAPGGTQGNFLALREDMLPVDTNVGGEFQRVEEPFWLMTNPVDSRYVVSMLNPRVFADFIDGDIEFSNGVVTFSGFDANGNLVEVVLTTGSSNATVNGQTVDIATFAGASGPNGSIQTINRNDRTFVPLRFLANAFLLDIRFQEGTVFLER